MTKRALVITGLALTCLCLIGCDLLPSAGPMVTDSRSVKQGGAKSVAVQMDMDVGDLKLTGGASDLMNAEFRYNIPGWKPVVQYTASGDMGTLVVRQPTIRNLRFRDAENHWDVRLRDLLPMDLTVRNETGDSNLSLNGLALTSLTVDSETGSTTVDLSGRYAGLKTLDIGSETGHCTVEMTGVYPSLSSISIKSQTGQCTAEMTGTYPSLSSINISTETGSVNANLAGHWTRSADFEIKSQTGSINVTVPTNVGVYITTHKETGSISASGLNAQGNEYTNDLYGKSPVTLRLNVSVETGSINLRSQH